MAVNIKASYKNIPVQTIGPFIATLETYSSSGITMDVGSVNPIYSTSGTTSTGFVETLNIGPIYTILKNDLTHQQLTDGYTFNQIKCGDTYLSFQSTNVCFTSYRADLVGLNGLPTLRLVAHNNNDGASVSSTLNVIALNNAPSPVPSTITVSSSTSGTTYSEISLGKGRYSFTLDITSPSPSVDRFAELQFIQCGSL